jgi:hypothetical protein
LLLFSVIATEHTSNFRPHKRWAPIIFLVGVRAITIDIMQEDLDEDLSLIGVAPMEYVDPAIDDCVPRREQGGVRFAVTFNTEWPRVARVLTDVEAHANFTCFSIAMTLEHVAAFVDAKIRIGRQKPQARILLNARSQIFEQAVECRIAVVSRRLRDLDIADLQ